MDGPRDVIQSEVSQKGKNKYCILTHMYVKKATHSSIHTWKIPWMEEPGRLQSTGSLRVGHDWAPSLSFSLSCMGEEDGNPLQCSCLEIPRDGGAWWAAVYGVAQSRTRLKRLSSSSMPWFTVLFPFLNTFDQVSQMTLLKTPDINVKESHTFRKKKKKNEVNFLKNSFLAIFGINCTFSKTK